MKYLIPDDHPYLSQKMPEFNFISGYDPVKLAEMLVAIMRKHSAMGLAANQVGILERVFVLAGNPPIVCFNPQIIVYSVDEVVLQEGCLSFPDLWINIKRSSMIKVSYFNEKGEQIITDLAGWPARCFQHELDHLDGKKFTERAHPIHLERARRQQKILRRKRKDA